ncbi:hypothetical protein F5B20DRAFT_227924 [Whalleya microplaca]|nr:hypothetical protein F5B20DRAFT_227924 [Whalleya microplaca]
MPGLTMLGPMVFLLALAAESASTCFDTNGNSNDIKFVPCNPLAEVSVCCGATDYCLSNGLCLDASGDNHFTVQGCTSSTWSSPCVQYCPNEGATTNLYQVLTLCSAEDRVSGQYCCGENATCCSVEESVSITLPIFTSAYKPSSTPSALGGASASFPPTSASESNTTTARSRSSDATAEAMPVQTETSSPSNKSLAIGLGVGLGVPLLLALVVASLFLCIKIQKESRLQKSLAKPGLDLTVYNEAYHTSTSVTQPPPSIELNTYRTEGEFPSDPNTLRWELPGDQRRNV